MDIVERYCEGEEAGTLIKEARDEIARLRDELERERMRLAARGVVALANAPDSANEARHMHESYKSASCDDVARMVDEQMRLRDENAKLRSLLADRAADHSHECIACHLSYTPTDDASEDCPACGCNGTDAWSKTAAMQKGE